MLKHQIRKIYTGTTFKSDPICTKFRLYLYKLVSFIILTLNYFIKNLNKMSFEYLTFMYISVGNLGIPSVSVAFIERGQNWFGDNL